MSYTKTTWNSGDVITAEKLNKIEDGVANNSNGLLVVTLTSSTSGLQSDKTAEDVYNAVVSGKQIQINKEYEASLFVVQLSKFYVTNGNYTVELTRIERGNVKTLCTTIVLSDDKENNTTHVDYGTGSVESVELVYINNGAPNSGKYVSGTSKANLSGRTRGLILGVQGGSFEKPFLFDGQSFYRFTYNAITNKLVCTFFTFSSETSQTELTKTEKTISLDASE